MVSREEWTVPRWARNAAGVDVGSPEVEEPPGGQKDSGWTSSDNPVRNWWNWLHREAGKMLQYLADFVSETNQANQIRRTAKAAPTDFANSVGVSQLTVAAGVAYIDGGRYEFPETVLAVPLQSTLALMHRIPVARLVGGVPTIALVDGTVNATDPTLLAGDIPLWRLVHPQDALPFSVNADLREYGRYEADSMAVDETLTINNVEFSTAKTQRRVLYADAFRPLSVNMAASYTGYNQQIIDGDVVMATIQSPPIGSVLASADFYINAALGAEGSIIRLERISKTAPFLPAVIGSGTIGTDGNTIVNIPVNETIFNTFFYRVYVQASGGNVVLTACEALFTLQNNALAVE